MLVFDYLKLSFYSLVCIVGFFDPCVLFSYGCSGCYWIWVFFSTCSMTSFLLCVLFVHVSPPCLDLWFLCHVSDLGVWGFLCSFILLWIVSSLPLSGHLCFLRIVNVLSSYSDLWILLHIEDSSLLSSHTKLILAKI